MSNIMILKPKADTTLTIKWTQSSGFALSRGTSACAVNVMKDRPAYGVLAAFDGTRLGSRVWRPPVC